MDPNFFIILFMIDLYKDNHVCACVGACMCAFVNFFFKKFLLKDYWLDFYQIS